MMAAPICGIASGPSTVNLLNARTRLSTTWDWVEFVPQACEDFLIFIEIPVDHPVIAGVRYYYPSRARRDFRSCEPAFPPSGGNWRKPSFSADWTRLALLLNKREHRDQKQNEY